MPLETKEIITIETNQATTSLKSLRDEIKQAKEAMLNSKEGTAEYANALQLAANKAFELREMQQKIRGTAKDLGEMLANGTKVLAGVASGFATAQGALSLFGIESEDLQKQLIKIQGAIALMQGLEGLEGLGKNLKNLGIQLMNFSVVQKVVTAAQWLWNAAMDANPLGAIILLITALITAVKALSNAFAEDTEKLDKERTALDGVKFASKELADEHNNHIKAMTELDQQLDVTTGKLTDFEKSMIDLKESYNQSLEEIKQNTATQLEEVNGFWDNLEGKRTLAVWKELLTREDREKKSAQIIKDAQQKALDAQEKYNKDQDLLKAKQAEKDKKEKEDQDKKDKKDAEDKAKEADRLRKETEKKEAEASKKHNDLLRYQNEIDRQIEKEAYALATETEAQQKALEEEVAAAEIQQQIDLGNAMFERQQEQAIKEIELEKRKKAAKIEVTQSTFQGIADLTSLFANKGEKAQKRAFEIQKIANAANATIDTYKAATEVFAQTPGGLVFKSIAAGAAIASGLLNVKKILSQKYESNNIDSNVNTSGGIGNNSGSITPPNIPQQITPSRNILTDNELNNNKMQPIRAYIVESDISNSQKKIEKLNNETTF
jgi:formate/nitrite transporter FocA (FNT family)